MEEARIVSLDEAYEDFQKAGLSRMFGTNVIGRSGRPGTRKQQWTQTRKGKLVTAHRRKSLPVKESDLAHEKRIGKETALKAKEVLSSDISELESYKPKTKQGATLKRKALSYYKEAISYYVKEVYNSDDLKEFKEMRKMHLGDAQDMLRIGRAIDEGNYSRASSVINRMDTAPREEVPESVFRFLDKNSKNLDWSYL
jgi:hypothetical protein